MTCTVVQTLLFLYRPEYKSKGIGRDILRFWQDIMLEMKEVFKIRNRRNTILTVKHLRKGKMRESGIRNNNNNAQVVVPLCFSHKSWRMSVFGEVCSVYGE